MNESLGRLLWALPLVLLIGVVAIVLLRRWLAVVGPRSQPAQPLVLKQSLALSDRATVHLLEVEGRRVLVVESAQALGTLELGATALRAVPASRRAKDMSWGGR